MAKKYRRKNRQMKLTITIPNTYANDEEFIDDLMAKLDSMGWVLQIGGDDHTDCDVYINCVGLGITEIKPEEDEE